MSTFTVTTGLGYFREIATGHVVSKARLPKGKHEIRTGFEYIEVEDADALNDIVIYIDPAIEKENADQAKISEALEKLAISQAKTDGYVFQSDKFKVK